MTSPAITVGAATHIPELARVMRVNRISGMPVVDDGGRLLGIVTDHDLILRNAPVREPRYFSVLSGMIPLNLEEYRHYKDQLRHTMAVTAADLIEPGIKFIAPDTPLEEVMEIMLDPQVTMLPVVEDERVVGVVTRTNLVRLVESLEGALDPAKQEAKVEDRLLTGVVSVILYVQDMGLMVAFYRDKLGFEVDLPADLPDYAQESWVVINTGATKLALNLGGSGRVGEDAPMIVFGVSDIEAARTILLERGVALEEVFDAGDGVKVVQGRDAEGNPISLEQRP
jgi:CBS domain-containing protein/catechol 2,3-dioxygenase-like lactoylglutathione lyase family enzyme